ncbi:serine/threonine-protein kinase [Stigmatella sp. ncwal1]|uniref:non-specific serine/threonine protein kinase n=1 Tax=Stigmatella ashevillensis TaxID=2995309 RepID=A0ABT5D5M1_9BACT|nr:serine/threonine-protein kinase [Stigmatella ashevillena]MDC0707537.1 serine/threonine-protein kinase [Stigmatella ashevillena]
MADAGTSQIGDWRVLATCGHGSYGIVHRVEHAEQPHLGPFALKLALHPDDPRFEREAELLSRIRHPHVPRLKDRGRWTLPGGPSFPYLVMEWVEGVSLYAWASGRSLTSRQMLKVLAQIARALEATHAVGGVHRDVKGDNIRVRPDGHAVLVDFGSSHYRDAPTLTRHLPPPGTAQYYSPESLRFQWEHHRQPTARYLAQPADDVYALGVTAYRLVTGRYPPAIDREKTEGGFRLVAPAWRPPPVWKNLSPELASLIRRMLSYEPSHRGTATDIASALERAAQTSRSRVDRPLLPPPARPPFINKPQSPAPRSCPSGWPVLSAALGVGLILGIWYAELRLWPETSLLKVQQQQGGAVGLADTVLDSSANSTSFEPMQHQFGRDLPKKPFPGQRRPPCKPPAIEVNGGCWGLSGNTSPPCGDQSVEWKKACYWPLLELPRPPTSETP